MKWERKSFAKVVNDITGGNRKFSSSEYAITGKFPIVDQGEKFIGGYTTSNDVVERKKAVVVFGDHTKILKFIDFDFCLGADGVKVLEPNDNLDTKFLYYCLQTVPLPDVGYSRHYKFLKECKIPLPPLPIQKQIADTLSKADALRQKDQQLLQKYDDLAQSIFYEMFGDPVRNERGWESGKVIDFADCIVPGRDKPKSFTGHIPWITTDDLSHLAFTYTSKKGNGLNEDEVKAVRARLIPAESVIMTCVGDLGIISIAGTDMVVNQQLHTFQCSDRMNPIFLMFLLSHNNEYMLKMASSTTVPYMNKTICNSVPVVCPPKEKQDVFASMYQQLVKQTHSVSESSTLANNLFDSLLKAYFNN